MITSISELFVLVPKGFGSKFIKAYANTEKYRTKVAFLEDTQEIWTNGKPFGLNNSQDIVKLQEELAALQSESSTNLQDAIAKEVQDRNEAIESLKNTILGEGISDTFDTLKEIENWLTEHGIQAANLMESLTDVTEDVNILKGDSSVIGSVLNTVTTAIDSLSSELTDYVDSNVATLNDVDASLNEKIEKNEESIITLNTEVATNKQTITDEITRAQAQEEYLESLINEIAAVNVWEEFEIDGDMPEITDDTIVAYTIDDIITEAEADSIEKDIIVTSNESMTYFSNSNAATFKNITI